MSPVSVATVHWWALAILCHPKVPFCACLQNRSGGLRSFYHCAVPAVSLCSSSCSHHRPAGLLWLQWDIAYAVALSSIMSVFIYTSPCLTHMLPLVSLRFSTTHGCVCSTGWCVLGQSFQNVLKESSDHLERYCMLIDLLTVRCLARLTVLINVKIGVFFI